MYVTFYSQAEIMKSDDKIDFGTVDPC